MMWTYMLLISIVFTYVNHVNLLEQQSKISQHLEEASESVPITNHPKSFSIQFKSSFKPIEYPKKEEMPIIYVNSVTPIENMSENYWFYSLPFCKPEKFEFKEGGIDEMLSASKLTASMIKLEDYNNKINKYCSKSLDQTEKLIFKERIDQDVIVDYIVDDIEMWDILGQKRGDKYYLKTFVEFHFYTENDKKSISDAFVVKENDIITKYTELNFDDKDQQIDFYYGVQWLYEEELHNSEHEQVVEEIYQEEKEEKQDSLQQNSSILNSFLLVFALVGLFVIVMIKTVHRDLVSSNFIETDTQTEIGWKMIKTEALMHPQYKIFLSAFIGNGIQFLILMFSFIIFGLIGFYNNHHQRQKSTLIFIYAFSGFINGFYNVKFYKFMGGKHWALNLALGTLLLPTIIVFDWVFIGVVHQLSNTINNFSFASFFYFFALFIFIQVPLTLGGGIAAKMKGDNIVEDKSIRYKKLVPKKKFYQNIFFNAVIGGCLPFTSIYFQLHYILNSIWTFHHYHLYSVLLITTILFLITVALTNISLTYFQLNQKDYNWQWRSFLNGGFPSIFLAIYSIHYYYTGKMHGMVQLVIFSGVMSISCFIFFIVIGTVGFLSSQWFVRYIYNNSKID